MTNSCLSIMLLYTCDCALVTPDWLHVYGTQDCVKRKGTTIRSAIEHVYGVDLGAVIEQHTWID